MLGQVAQYSQEGCRDGDGLRSSDSHPRNDAPSRSIGRVERGAERESESDEGVGRSAAVCGVGGEGEDSALLADPDGLGIEAFADHRQHEHIPIGTTCPNDRILNTT